MTRFPDSLDGVQLNAALQVELRVLIFQNRNRNAANRHRARVQTGCDARSTPDDGITELANIRDNVRAFVNLA
jgi:hypothetical protein